MTAPAPEPSSAPASGPAEVHRVCTRFHAAVELIGARWSGAVLRVLFTGAHRFADIRAAVPGVSDTMLTQRLRELEREGLLTREVLATSPVRVEYHLTPKGAELEPAFHALMTWSHRWIPLPTGTTDPDDVTPPAPPAQP
jgi:DNA-binding HxlR family transcriptional regulator